MDAYEQIRIIGKGSFGVVTQIVRKADRKVRADATLRGRGDTHTRVQSLGD